MKSLKILAKFTKVRRDSAVERYNRLTDHYEAVCEALRDLSDLYYYGEENAEVNAQYRRAIDNRDWLCAELKQVDKIQERLSFAVTQLERASKVSSEIEQQRLYR